MSLKEPHYYLGIDGGGTGCRAVLQNTEGKTLGFGRAGMANPAYGIEAAQQSILEASYAALADAKLPTHALSDLVVGAGLAGVDIPRFLNAMQQWEHPFNQWFVTHDLPIACLGAHAQLAGAVIITGTGSSGYARMQDKEIFAGGYGFPHGDQASGAWLGFSALQAVFLANDSLGQETTLTHLIPQYLSIAKSNKALADHFIGKPSRVYASLAPMVLSQYQKDPIATNIIDQALDYLTKLGKKLLDLPTIELALIGGLSHFYHDQLKPTFGSRLIKPKDNPEQGAILFAIQQHKKIKKDKTA